MDVKKVPIVGKIHSSLTHMTVNLILLAVVMLVLGILIPFYPQVLDVMVASLLIVSSAIMFSIAYNVHSYKKRIKKWFDK